MARRRWVLWLAVVAVVGGCGPPGNDPGGDGLERLRRQAHEALARYDKAVRDTGGTQRFIPVGELTGQVGNWESTNGTTTSQRCCPAASSPPRHCRPRRNQLDRWFGTTGRPRQSR